MAQFIVRVELQNATPEDYEILHNAMYIENLYKIIADDSTGKYYHLPTAEYNYIGNIDDREIILTKAERAAVKTNRKHSILVTKSAGIIFTGLDELKTKT